MLAPPLAVPNHLIGLNDVLRLLFVFWSLFSPSKCIEDMPLMHSFHSLLFSCPTWKDFCLMALIWLGIVQVGNLLEWESGELKKMIASHFLCMFQCARFFQFLKCRLLGQEACLCFAGSTGMKSKLWRLDLPKKLRVPANRIT